MEIMALGKFINMTYQTFMIQVNIDGSKAKLSKYTRMVKAGETVVLCDSKKPFAEIRLLSRKGAYPNLP